MTKAKSEKNAPNKSQKQDVGSKALKRLQIIVNNEIQTPEAIDRMKQDLNNANKIIHKCLDSFLDVLVQLAIVKEKELWKVGCDKQNKYFKTFEQYTESEFGFRRAYLSRLKKAGEAYKWLQDKDTEKASELPQHPAFYMALSEIPENDRIDVITKWEGVTGKRTASKLIKVWEELHEGKKLEKPQKETDYGKKIKSVLGVLICLNDDIINNQYKQVDEESLKKLKETINAIQANLNGNNNKGKGNSAKVSNKTSETDKLK